MSPSPKGGTSEEATTKTTTMAAEEATTTAGLGLTITTDQALARATTNLSGRHTWREAATTIVEASTTSACVPCAAKGADTRREDLTAADTTTGARETTCTSPVRLNTSSKTTTTLIIIEAVVVVAATAITTSPTARLPSDAIHRGAATMPTGMVAMAETTIRATANPAARASLTTARDTTTMTIGIGPNRLQAAKATALSGASARWARGQDL